MKRNTKRIKYSEILQNKGEYTYLYVNTTNERFLCSVKDADSSELDLEVLYFYKEDTEHQKNLPMMYVNRKSNERRVFATSQPKLRKIDPLDFAEFLL